MEKPQYTDKDVAYQIAQILVREISRYQQPEGLDLANAVEQMIESGSTPLLTYATLAGELNKNFDIEAAANKFTPLNIDTFLGILLKESIDFQYKIEGVSHLGRIRKKLDCDIPITAIVVNAKTHLPGKQFFTYFDLPHATDDELRASTKSLLQTLLTFNDWDLYLKRVEKVFGRK